MPAHPPQESQNNKSSQGLTLTSFYKKKRIELNHLVLIGFGKHSPGTFSTFGPYLHAVVVWGFPLTPGSVDVLGTDDR